MLNPTVQFSQRIERQANQMPEQNASNDERTLIARAVAGSFTAFEGLVSLYEKRIYGFVFQSCRNSADAQEVTQDTFVRAFQALEQFDLAYPFGPWLFAIARRKCIDFHRAQGPACEHRIPERTDPDDPAMLLSQREERESLWCFAQRKLGRLEFEVLWLKYVEEMEVGAIARVIGKTKTHVKVLLFRARKALGREIEIASQEPQSKSATIPSQARATISPVII